jgi:YHS domain-containing protein
MDAQMRKFTLALLVALSTTFLTTSFLANAQDAASKATIAIKGYDPVAYFVDKMPVAGKAEFVATHNNFDYQFASAKNRDAFVANPDKYAPQYGGYCAFGATRGYKAAIDPASFTIRDDKLYLNYSAKVQSMWEKDIPGFIKLADEKWPETMKTTKVIQ